MADDGKSEQEVEVGQVRALIVETSPKTLRVVIPEGSCVTFGPVVPFTGKRETFGSTDSGTCLRIYRDASKKDQLALFRNVKSFRDESMEVYEQMTDMERQASLKNTADGQVAETREILADKWVRV